MLENTPRSLHRQKEAYDLARSAPACVWGGGRQEENTRVTGRLHSRRQSLILNAQNASGGGGSSLAISRAVAPGVLALIHSTYDYSSRRSDVTGGGAIEG